jgi:hypothetical protein
MFVAWQISDLYLVYQVRHLLFDCCEQVSVCYCRGVVVTSIDCYE